MDASSLTADAAAERAQTAKSLNVDALCVVGDALTADDGSGKRGELGNKDEALAPGLETAVRAQANHFPGGASVVRCEMVLGSRGCDEAFQYRNHPLAYFFERFARNRMAPIPGPGPRAGGPPMLVGAARAADVAQHQPQRVAERAVDRARVRAHSRALTRAVRFDRWRPFRLW